jgi:hypothetical protein
MPKMVRLEDDTYFKLSELRLDLSKKRGKVLTYDETVKTILEKIEA